MERRHRRRVSGKSLKKKQFTALYISCIVLLLIAAGGYLFRKPLTLVAFDLFVSPTLEKKAGEVLSAAPVWKAGTARNDG